MEFRQRDDQRNDVYGEGRSEKLYLKRGTIREMEFRQRDDQRNGIYGERRSERKKAFRERDGQKEGLFWRRTIRVVFIRRFLLMCLISFCAFS
jgi:hypothetical protein